MLQTVIDISSYVNSYHDVFRVLITKPENVAIKPMGLTNKMWFN